MGMTISESMVMMKTIRERISSLSHLRNANAVERRTYYLRDNGEEKQRDEINANYDPKVLDKKITELERELFKIDVAIKKANAKTDVGVEVDIDVILAPVE